MLKRIIISSLLLIAGIFTYAKTGSSDESLKNKWRKVDSLERMGLPKSAEEVVDQILSVAKEKKMTDQLIKATMYKMKEQYAVEDIEFSYLISYLDSIAKVSPIPEKNIMHSMLAEMYWMYYQSNRWDFHNRTKTVGYDNRDIATWSLEQLIDKCAENYLQSLNNEAELKKHAIEKFDLITYTATEKSRQLRPSLFEFLAHRALHFFATNEAGITKPKEEFFINETVYFSDQKSFSAYQIITDDSLSFTYLAVELYQKLLSSDIRSENSDALLQDDLARLEFVHQKSILENKDRLYLMQLQQMTEQYASQKNVSEVYYKIGQYYNALGKKYNPKYPGTATYKEYNIKAVELCRTTSEKYPKTRGAELCKQLLTSIKNGQLDFTAESTIASDQKFTLQIKYQNIEKVYCRIAAIDRKEQKSLYEKYYNQNNYIENRDEKYFDELKRKAKTTEELQFELPASSDYNQHISDVICQGLPLGMYLIIVANNPQFTYEKATLSYSLITVSDMACFIRDNAKGVSELRVVHRHTGEPLEKVKVVTGSQSYNYTKRKYEDLSFADLYTDKDGYVKLPNQERYMNINFELELGDDYLDPKQSLHSRPAYEEKAYKRQKVYFFTDRAIYRPGQTIYFKGIVFDQQGKELEIAPGRRLTIMFEDVNGKNIHNETLTTNEYGSVNGQFTIPQGLLNGQMRLKTNGGDVYVQVEEYKRPKFEVTVDKLKGDYLLNEEIRVSGKAISYSGAPLSEASVQYKVVRIPVWKPYWWGWNAASEKIISHGTLETDANGGFIIPFIAEPDYTIGSRKEALFKYKIEIDVSDITGEVQSTTTVVNVGNVAMKLNVDMPRVCMQSEDIQLLIHSTNLNEEKVSARGNVTIYKLIETTQAMRWRVWDAPDVQLYEKDDWYKIYPGNVYGRESSLDSLKYGEKVFEAEFNTPSSSELKIFNTNKWQIGRYVVVVHSTDVFGNAIIRKKYFSLINEKSKHAFCSVRFGISPIKNSGEPGESARFILASAVNAVVYYEIEHNRKIVDRKFLRLSNEQNILDIPILESYRGNFAVHFYCIENNRVYNQTENITVPFSNKKLNVEFASFRDKLYPSQDEQWRMTIKGPDGEKVAAEMLATLYDASLDQFKPHGWGFGIYPSISPVLAWRKENRITANTYKLENDFYQSYWVEGIYHPTLNWFGFGYYRNSFAYYEFEESEVAEEAVPVGYGVKKSKNSKKRIIEVADAEVMADETSVVTMKSEEMAENNDAAPEEKVTQNVQVRTNFNETAFFYPDLHTDEDGNVIVKFTIPESLTKWKMLGMAHTKDLKYAIVENELITQKDLMVVPNPPRFFREGDVMEFPVKVSNLSETELEGVAELQFFDAFTQKPVAGILADSEQEQKQFSVTTGGNTLLVWKIKIPEGISVLTYKVVAKSGQFSDGEQKVIPVLTNRMLVTESLPLPITQKGKKKFTFEKLLNSGQSSTLGHHRLTVEFTSNPAWYAVQALPYIMEYPYECSEQTFSRFYANSIATHIVNSSPRIKQIFDSWKDTPDSEALLSNLEKNQELKSLLLQETPWIMNAQNESERKRRVGLLFDLNRMSNELERALDKLQKAQTVNGGWAWFPGMPESEYISRHIVCGMGHLYKLGITNIKSDPEVWKMITKGVSFIDDGIKKDYEAWLRYKKKYPNAKPHIDYDQIHYLYSRSFFVNDIKIPGRIKEAFDFYFDLAKKQWVRDSRYAQGMIALALSRFGDYQTPKSIIKSLSEYAIHNEELGMYWKENVAGYFWYQAPIETQALMIELYSEVALDSIAVNEMKVWLLKNKQTNDWKTTKATAEAVYALLLQGADWLANSDFAELKVGKEKIDPTNDPELKAEAGTGYFKKSYNGAEIYPDMGNVEVYNPNNSVAWGAVYWQYFEQLDKITPHETPLRLKKQLFREVRTDKGTVIEPIQDSDILHVGDKVIVRIELRVDREMEYVHMKDMRASGFEPINVISQYKYQDGLGYYESTKDAATNFFFSYLQKGTYVFEYPLWVQQKGDFSNGITTIQCMYAPEFTSHSEGVRVKVE